MLLAAVAVAFTCALCLFAFRANARFRNSDLLPMQWWLNGEVTWSAPRVLALSLVPVLATLVLSLTAMSAVTLQPRAGQKGLELPALLVIGIIFLAIQRFHLWMIERTVNGNGS